MCRVCLVERDDEQTEGGPDLDAPLCWYCARPVASDGYCSALCAAAAERESEGDDGIKTEI